MDEKDYFYALTEHLAQKHSAVSSAMWFYNANYEPKFCVKLPQLYVIISFSMIELDTIYKEHGFNEMCKIIDDNIENIRNHFG